jgi:hypothetical protein
MLESRGDVGKSIRRGPVNSAVVIGQIDQQFGTMGDTQPQSDRGWVKVKNGDVTEGLSLLQSGSTAYRASGVKLFVPHYIDLLASAPRHVRSWERLKRV